MPRTVPMVRKWNVRISYRRRSDDEEIIFVHRHTCHDKRDAERAAIAALKSDQRRSIGTISAVSITSYR